MLLEREADLDALAALAPEGGLALVGGEAGIGKTSLIAALGERFVLRIGACEPLSVPAPLAPLRELEPALDGDDRLAQADALLAALAPGVAVVEDAHWADPATLDVLRLLARRLPGSGLLLVVTYRDDEAAANPPLTALLGDLAPRREVLRRTLRPLSDAALRELAGPAAAELARLTGGNPFLVAESLAAPDGVPGSVRDATLARVVRLSPAARAAAEAAAVLGQRVRPEQLLAVAPDSGADVAEAIARGVLIDDGQALGFRHELTRQAIETAIPAPRRLDLHRRAVAALEGTGEHARLAHHAEQGGLVADAARHAALAAAEAERVGALREASLQLERALRLGSDLAPAERFDLLVRCARVTNFAADMKAALRYAEEALALARRELGPSEEGRALNVLTAARWSLELVTEARAAAQEAIVLLGDDPGELARAHGAYLRIEAVAFDPAVAIAAAPEALAAAERAGHEEVRVDSTISLAVAQGYRGEPGADEALAAASAAADAAGLHFQAIRARINGLAVAADARDHATLDALAGPARALFEERQAAPARDYAAMIVARSRFDRGQYDAALEEARLSRRSPHGGTAVALLIEGLVRARRGEPGGDERIDAALALLAGVPDGARHGLLLAGLAESAWLRGDLAAARAHAEAGLAAPHAAQFARSAGDLAVWGARTGATVAAPALACAPARAEVEGDWRAAVSGWRALDAPYEAALAALPGDDRAAAEAMAALKRLGADGAAAAFARTRAEQGARAVRGPRRSTLQNAAGLTRREQEVLGLVAGGATNGEIAAALHLSERTVAHHVSAILGKLGAPTRTAAVQAARAAGALAQDGQPPGAR